MRPAGVMSAGMMPALLTPGDATPGQFGPTMRVLLPAATLCAHAAVESCTGMPSVITMASSIPASIASMMAPLANFGGTKMTVTFAPVAAIASLTELNTGSCVPSKSTRWPPLPGVTPPTTAVPAASMRRVCFEPSEPVMPCTMTRESSVNQIAMSLPHGREFSGATSRTVHRVHPLHERIARTVQDGSAGLRVVAIEPDHKRLRDRLAALGEHGQRLDDTVRDRVARCDATEHVDEHTAHRRIRQHDLQAVGHHRRRRTAADVEEVGRPYAAEVPAGVGNHVQGGHHEAGAVADDADRTVELHVVEVAFLRALLQRIGGRDVLERLVVGMAERGVAVERDLRIQKKRAAPCHLGERVHLDEQRVLRHERLP